MFTFENFISSPNFIRKQSTGYVSHCPEVSVCLVEFDKSCYKDTLFEQMSLSLPDVLKSAVSKRKAEYLAGRHAAKQLLQSAGSNAAIAIGQDRAPVWPSGWTGSISHNETWAIAILTPQRSGLNLGVDIETYRPEIMPKIAPIFTIVDELDLLAASGLPMEKALFITFSAKESLFKALYPLVQCMFGFEAAKICEIDPLNYQFVLELTVELAPGLGAGYRITGHYLTERDGVTTMIII